MLTIILQSYYHQPSDSMDIIVYRNCITLQLLEIQPWKRLVVRYGKSPWRYDENQDRPRHPFRVTQCGARDSQYGGPCPPRIAAVGGYKPFVSRLG